MKRVVLAAAGGLAALVLAAVAYLWTLDPDDFRQEILAEVEQRTGRIATLGAPIELSLSLRPVLVLRGFTLSGDARGDGPALIAVERAEAEADLPDLLRGELTIRRLEVHGADVLLQADGDGGGNWEFPAAAGADASADAGASAGARASLARARLTDSTIRYRSPDGTDTTLQVEQLDLSRTAPGDLLDFTFRGALDDVALSAAGRSGLIADLLRSAAPWPIDARATLLGAEITVAGDIERPWSAEGLSLQVSLAGADLAPVAAQLQLALPAGLPWSLRARVTGSAAELRFQDLAAALGDNRVHGALLVSSSGPRPHIGGQLHAERLDLLQVAGAAPGGAAPGERQRVFAETPFDLGLLRAVDADLEVSGEAVATPLGAVSELLARVVLADGALAVQPLDAHLERGSLHGNLRVAAPAQRAPELSLTLDARQVDVARLFRRFGHEPLLDGRADVRASLTGSGASPAAVAGRLDGRLQVLMRGGRGRLSMIESLVGGVTKVLGDVGGRDGGEWTSLNCLAADFAIRDGIARREVLLLDTESVTVTGDGSIDLGRERLDLEITPQPKSATLNLSVAVDVGGTLLAPTFTADTASAARRVGSLLGGLLFPPAALAAFADLGSGDENPCPGIAAGGAPARGARPATPARATPAAPRAAPRPRDAMN